jgi:Tol biopolymer transport system component
MCYEKLGLNQAQKAYQKVVDNFPEQTEEVKVANEKLSLLLRTETVIRKEDKEFNIRKVWAGPDVDILGAPSPDGRYLSYVDWDTGDLAIYEIATGKKRRLTNKGSWDESIEYAIFSRWSPDGKQIVYQWYNENEFIDLYIIGLDGSKPRILYSNEDGEYAETYDWSPDGKQILACFYRKDGTNQMVLFSAADGSVRVLKILEQGDPVNMSFSPDGRCIVYDYQQKEGSPERDISLLSTDGSREISLVEHPANDYVLGWAPDGKNILFASDRTGILDGWVIQVADGKPQGVPELVKPNMIVRRFVTMGFTRDGSFYYGCQGGRIRDVYIAKLDPETGEILGPPKKVIKRFEGYNQSPDYSPDGKYLAYISTRGTFGGILNRPRALCIRSLETGEEREFFPKLKRIDLPRWSPDCRSILVWGIGNKGRGIFQIDAQTGTVTPVVLSGAEEYETVYSGEWSHDGKAIFYVRSNDTNNLRQILVRNLESGTEKELYRTSDDDRFNLSCSPDGKWLAFINREKGVLRIMPAAGGEPRELYRCKQGDRLATLRWTPDGKYILFVIRQPEYNLWRIPIEGGKPEKLGLDIVNLSVHPDGQHIAFYNSTSKLAEVWVMENFLPTGVSKAK